MMSGELVSWLRALIVNGLDFFTLFHHYIKFQHGYQMKTFLQKSIPLSNWQLLETPKNSNTKDTNCFKVKFINTFDSRIHEGILQKSMFDMYVYWHSLLG